MKSFVAIFLLSLSLVRGSARADRVLQIMVVHPKPDACSAGPYQGTSQCSELWSSSGVEDIFSVANRTASEINSCSELLDGLTVRVESVSSYFPCSVVDLTKLIKNPSENITGIIGMVGLVGESFARNILPLPSDLGITQIIQPALGLMLNPTKHYPHLYTTSPSVDQYVTAVIKMLEALEWTTVGLIYDREESMYARTAERFITLSNCSDAPIAVREFVYNTETLNEIRTNSHIKVFILLLPLNNLSSVLCAVQREGLVWPSHAWIILSHRLTEFELFQCSSSLSLTEVLENTLIVASPTKPSGKKIRNMSCERSYWNVYHSTSNSLWSLAMALNQSTQLPFISNNSTLATIQSYLDRNPSTDIQEVSIHSVEKSLINISQVQSGQERTISYFNYATRELSIDYESLGPVRPTISPSPEYEYELFTPLLTALLVTVIALCILFTTIVLALFIYHRKEPEVKASSVSLSLCMFIGFYLLQFSSLVHFVDSGRIITSIPEKYFSCCFTTYCASLGIDIVLATLLMKLLRVWRIFTMFGKTGKFWTDHVMLVLTGVIVSVKVVILIIWVAADTYMLVDVIKTTSSGEKVIVQQCESNMTALWSVLSYGYSGILGLCLILAAIKTRKIKHNNFKDTKKICILICILIYVAFVTGALWGVLRISGDNIGSKIIIGIAYTIEAVLCLGFLFAPKVSPSLKRKTADRVSVRRRLVSQNTTTSIVSF